RSMLAVLFMETVLMPIQIRCLLLALGCLRYMADLGDDRTVRVALIDSVDLFAARLPGWAGDVAIMLSILPTPIRIPPTDFLSVPTIDTIIAKVSEVVDADLKFNIDHLQKTDLLCNRLELVKDRLQLVTRRHRHYLTLVLVPAHRKALTGLLLEDHTLSVERLRYPVRYRLPVPREECLCHFCQAAAEDEVHVLLDCDAHAPLTALRETFLKDSFTGDPVLEPAYYF
ncbi:hypothetical protein B0H17DRAFT_941069, partial [Mycena rosella]